MIKALIFDADGPLYQRGDISKTQKIELLRRYGFAGKYRLFDEAYNAEKLKAYDQTEPTGTMFVNIFKALGVRLDTKQSERFTDEFNNIQSQVEPSPFARETLKWLHESGYKISILTNSFFSASEMAMV